MKRTLRLLAAALMLTAALSVGAAAADFEPVAQELSTIGMFRGTGSGFELDRAPTRAEAAIMLVRLYGAEDSAAADYAAGSISHPFTDVPAYAAPHVAWLYTEGLTKGVSADKFGSAELCSVQSYATFLLRALGYKDGEDFEYADALTCAQEKGFYMPMMFLGDFLRDDLAALTYQALAADTAEGDTYLLKTLVDSGAVDKSAAQPMMEKMELYREVSAAEMALSADEVLSAMDMDMAMEMDISVTADGVSETVNTTIDGSVAMKMLPDGDMELAYVLDTTIKDLPMEDGTLADQTVTIGLWMKDGWMYMSTNDPATGAVVNAKYPMEGAMTDLDMQELLDSLEIPMPTGSNVNGLAMVKSIAAEKKGRDTVYTMVITDGYGGMFDELMNMAGTDLGATSLYMDMEIGECTLVYTLDRKGELKDLVMSMPMSMSMSAPDETGAMSTIQMSYDLSANVVVNAIGEDVEITFPRFDSFVEVDPNASLPIA